MQRVFREEKKYLIHTVQSSRIRNRLESVMTPDTHNGPNGYSVRSLYFDTVYDDGFFEKRAGIERRRKIRLRVYGAACDFAMLEMKQKQGAWQLKRSLRVSRADAVTLSQGNYEPLLAYREPFAAECYALMRMSACRPVCVVQYDRKAFIAKENRIRVTLDSGIVATESRFDLFSPRLNMNPVWDNAYTVLEIKYNGFMLDHIRRLLGDVDKSELSVSKYVLARAHACQTRMP